MPAGHGAPAPADGGGGATGRRGIAPSPGTLLDHDTDALRIACGEHGHEVLRVSRAQLPGGKPLAVRDLLNARGDRLPPGLRLGQANEETP